MPFKTLNALPVYIKFFIEFRSEFRSSIKSNSFSTARITTTELTLRVEFRPAWLRHTTRGAYPPQRFRHRIHFELDSARINDELPLVKSRRGRSPQVQKRRANDLQGSHQRPQYHGVPTRLVETTVMFERIWGSPSTTSTGHPNWISR
jgi:hypothetical protein